MTLEEMIKEMGYGFRQLTYHSVTHQNRWSCRIGYLFTTEIVDFWGDTPYEAVKLAYDYFMDEPE
jgi:hypothetical protein